jgi:hypothetical protein
MAGTPSLVKTADPYSTLVLSPFDDGGIPAASYPNLPAYPVGQERSYRFTNRKSSLCLGGNNKFCETS